MGVRSACVQCPVFMLAYSPKPTQEAFQLSVKQYYINP